MKQYTVTGMSCAACSARVEKAVSKVDGVTSCSVSLLTNSMGVDGTASDAAIVAAVEAAGYGASPKGTHGAEGSSSLDGAGSNLEQLAAAQDALVDRETPKLKKRRSYLYRTGSLQWELWMKCMRWGSNLKRN